MSLLEFKKKKKAKTKQYNGNGQAEKGIERFVPSLVLGAFIKKLRRDIAQSLEGGKKEIKTASRDELVALPLCKAVGTMFHFLSSSAFFFSPPPNF